MLLEVIKDTVFDSLRLLPFLFLTYLLMEFLEHRAGDHVGQEQRMPLAVLLLHVA